MTFKLAGPLKPAWRFSRLASAISVGVALAATTTVSTAAHDSTRRVWEGSLEVSAHAGPTCSSQPKLPYRLAIRLTEGLQDRASLFVWGEVQAAWIEPSAANQAGGLRVIDAEHATGQVRVDLQDTRVHGLWQEEPSQAGCNFTAATLELSATTDPEARRLLLQQADLLVSAQSAQRALMSATDRDSARRAIAGVTAIADVVSRSSPYITVNAELALRLLDSGVLARAYGERLQALQILSASSGIYRALSHDKPEHAALALAREASLRHRVQGFSAAKPLIDEAMAILRKAGRESGEAAAHLHSQLGAWRLRAGDVSQAFRDFEVAVRIEVARNAPPLDRAAALNNLAQAVQRLGNMVDADALFRRALADAESSPAEGSSLAAVIRQNLEALQADRSGALANGVGV